MRSPLPLAPRYPVRRPPISRGRARIRRFRGKVPAPRHDKNVEWSEARHLVIAPLQSPSSSDTGAAKVKRSTGRFSGREHIPSTHSEAASPPSTSHCAGANPRRGQEDVNKSPTSRVRTCGGPFPRSGRRKDRRCIADGGRLGSDPDSRDGGTRPRLNRTPSPQLHRALERGRDSDARDGRLFGQRPDQGVHDALSHVRRRQAGHIMNRV